MADEDEEDKRRGPPKIPPALRGLGAEEEAPQEKPKIPRVSFTPSGLKTTPFEPSERREAPPTLAYPMPERRGGGGGTSIIAIIALVIAIASLAFSFFIIYPQYDAMKNEAKSIASDLRALKEKNITVTAPITATAKVDKTIPASDIFPATFYLPLDFNMPIDVNVTGTDTSGRPYILKVKESVPIKANIPIDTTSAMAQDLLTIKEDIPIDLELTTGVKVGSAYGSELDRIIEKLEKMGS